MKALHVVLTIFVALFTTAVFAQSDSHAAFEKLKSLEGSWVGQGSEGQPIQETFHVTSGGSALMNELHGDMDMVTMFHMDGERLMMTHYCGAGNQPRMLGTMSPDGKTVTFNFLDATNVLSTQPGHMQQLVVTMIDGNHHTEDWAFLTQDGKMQHHQHFDLRRK
jgi:hypothetical protein